MTTADQQGQPLDIEAIKSEIAEKGKEFVGKATEFAKTNPHLAVGAALGVGWILGNGLPPRVIMGAAKFGWRAMLGGALAGSGLVGMLSDSGLIPALTGTGTRGSNQHHGGGHSSGGARRANGNGESSGQGGTRPRNGSSAGKE